jgi:hypothetical protein
MPTAIVTKHPVPSVYTYLTACGFLRFGTGKVILAVWTVTVLLIGVYACFDSRQTFLSAFDVSVAPF